MFTLRSLFFRSITLSMRSCKAAESFVVPYLTNQSVSVELRIKIDDFSFGYYYCEKKNPAKPSHSTQKTKIKKSHQTLIGYLFCINMGKRVLTFNLLLEFKTCREYKKNSKQHKRKDEFIISIITGFLTACHPVPWGTYWSTSTFYFVTIPKLPATIDIRPQIRSPPHVPLAH